MKHLKRFSPSKLEGLELCPCFEYLEDDSSPQEDGEETPAQRGTRLHKAAETRDLSLCQDEMEREQVQLCLDYQDSLKAVAGPGATVRYEMRVRVGNLTYGTADFTVLRADRREAWLADWKFIRTPSVTDARVNLQVASYCAGLLHRFKRLETVHGNLLAPALRHIGDAATFTRASLTAVEDRIKRVIAAANDPFKTPKPGDLCGNCANARRCPALNAIANTAGQELGLPIPDAFRSDLAIDPRERAIAHVLANALATWAEQVKKHNNEYARSGGELPGHSVVRRAGNVSVRPGILAIERLQGAGILNYQDLLDCTKLRLPEVIDRVSQNESIGREDARNRVLEALGDLVTRGDDICYLQRRRSVSQEEIVRGLPAPTEGG